MAVISICRGTKSGGRALAECLAERLGYPMLGREVAQEAAAQLGVPARDLEERMEQRPGVFGRASLLTRIYVAAVRAALADAAADGNLVYHGLAGGLLLRDMPGILCTRLIAPLPMRVQAVMEAEGLDEASAEAFIRDVDDARARWVRVVYGEDIANPELYDLILNLETFTVPEACDVLCRTISRPEYELTPERLADLHDYRTQCHLQLALLEDLGTQNLPLEAEVHRGIAVIRGEAPMLRGGEMGERLVQIGRSVEGVREVRLEIEWFDPYP